MKVLFAVLHRRYLFIVVFSLVVFTGIARNRFHDQAVQYRFLAKLRIIEFPGFDADYKTYGATRTMVATHLETLTSTDFLQFYLKRTASPVSIIRLAKSFKASIEEDGSTLYIRFYSKKPSLPNIPANDIAQSYVDYDMKSKINHLNKKEKWIQSRREISEHDLIVNQNEIKSFLENHPVSYQDARYELNTYVKQMEALQISMEELRTVENMIGKSLSTMDSVLFSREHDDFPLKKELLNLKLTKVRLESRYHKSHYKVKQVDAQIRQIKKMMEDPDKFEAYEATASPNPAYLKMLEDLRDAEEKRALLRVKMNTLKEYLDLSLKKTAAAPEADYQYRQLLMEKNRIMRELTDLDEKYISIQHFKAFIPQEVYFTKAADNPGEMERMDHIPVSLLLILGSIIGTMGVYTAKYLSKKIYIRKDFESATGVEILCITPRYKCPVNPYGMEDLDMEPYVRLIQNTSCSPAGKAGQVRMLVETGSGEGNATTAALFAVTLAENAQKVLLIDTNVHHPKIDSIFKISGQSGYAQILFHSAHWTSCLQKSQLENLDLISAGPALAPTESPPDWDHIRQTLAELRKQYDVIILYSPPILCVTESLILANETDSLLLVLRCGKTTFVEVQANLDQMKYLIPPLSGAILTEVPVSGLDKYYYNSETYDYVYKYA